MTLIEEIAFAVVLAVAAAAVVERFRSNPPAAGSSGKCRSKGFKFTVKFDRD